MEVWKDIEGYEGYYQVSSLGRIKSLIRKSTGTNTTKESFIKPFISLKGYFTYRLSKKGVSKNYLLHRILAIAFIPNPDNKKCINHKNGIRLDNRLENLEWTTYSENSKHGFISNKRKNTNRKLTEEQVNEIKKELLNYKIGDGVRLSKKYGVSTFIISLIKVGKSYKDENMG